jgi:hypothetical protein
MVASVPDAGGEHGCPAGQVDRYLNDLGGAVGHLTGADGGEPLIAGLPGAGDVDLAKSSHSSC